MKKLLMFLTAALFVFGCTTPASQTTPVDTKDEERSAVSPPPPKPAEEAFDATTESPADPGVSGYGNDPGEETQE